MNLCYNELLKRKKELKVQLRNGNRNLTSASCSLASLVSLVSTAAERCAHDGRYNPECYTLTWQVSLIWQVP